MTSIAESGGNSWSESQNPIPATGNKYRVKKFVNDKWLQQIKMTALYQCLASLSLPDGLDTKIICFKANT